MIDTRTAPYAALLLRVSLFIAHGLLLKVFTFGVAGRVGYFESSGWLFNRQWRRLGIPSFLDRCACGAGVAG